MHVWRECLKKEAGSKGEKGEETARPNYCPQKRRKEDEEWVTSPRLVSLPIPQKRSGDGGGGRNELGSPGAHLSLETRSPHRWFSPLCRTERYAQSCSLYRRRWGTTALSAATAENDYLESLSLSLSLFLPLFRGKEKQFVILKGGRPFADR